MGETARAMDWMDGMDRDRRVVDLVGELVSRMEALEHEAARERRVSSVTQWGSVAVAVVGLVAGFWGVTTKLESRITKLETQIEFLRQDVGRLSGEIAAGRGGAVGR